MLNRIVRYFDLQSALRPLMAEGQSAAGTYAPVLPQYIVVSAGVVIEPFLRGYVQNSVWQYQTSALIGRVIFGLVIGIILLPAVYKGAFDAHKPVLVQIAALFPVGIGWQSLFTAATKIAAI